MPHPNQLALPVAIDRWIQQSQTLHPVDAIERLSGKLALVTEAINIIASDADEIPAEFEGLSVVDLMSAQATLTVEIGVLRQWEAAGMQVAA